MAELLREWIPAIGRYNTTSHEAKNDSGNKYASKH
jgi:hypothetical protein